MRAAGPAAGVRRAWCATCDIRRAHGRRRRSVPTIPTPPRLDPAPAPPELSGRSRWTPYIRRALAENRTVQAAWYNVLSLRAGIPQVTALDDPVASNTIFPIPSVAPQYSLMGYNPYNLTLAQQFPWFGTLRLRGEAAEQDVQVALAELAAAQLDAVAAVKRAYYDLYVSEQAEAILAENRKILRGLPSRSPATRLATGRHASRTCSGPRWLISELDRELASNRQGIAAARADLARQLHVSPEADLRTLPELPLGGRPGRGRAALPAGRRRPPRAARAGWPPSPATRRPSSWPASGTTPTSRSA